MKNLRKILDQDGYLRDKVPNLQHHTPSIEQNDFYRVSSNPRGIVYIFDNAFVGEKNNARIGSEKDVKNLDEIFKKMGYKVKKYSDKTRDETIESLNHIQSDHDLRSVDSFILVILSHGRENNCFYANDMKDIDLDDVRYMFVDSKCHALKGKPIPGKVVPIFSNNNAQMENLRNILDQDGIRELPLVVMPIAGEYRQGKSFLLSYLLRYLRDKDFGDEDEPLDGLFDHKKLSEPVTQGISTWNQPISVEVPKDDGSKKEVRKVLRFVPRSPNKMSWGYGLSILLALVYTGAAEGPYKITPGSALLLTCSDTKIGVDAYVEWIKDGEDDNILKADNKYELLADRYKLNIMDTGPDDAGFYECRNKKSPQLSMQFSVFYFNLEDMKTSLTETENDVVELKCLANGKPIPTVQWLKDGKKLNDSKISNAELSFKNATKKDGGNYTCQVFSDVEPDKHFSTSTYVCVCWAIVMPQ